MKRFSPDAWASSLPRMWQSQMSEKSYSALVVLILGACSIVFFVGPEQQLPTAVSPIDSEIDPFPDVTVDVPGVTNHPFRTAGQVEIGADELVVGVEVNGESRAWVLSAMGAPDDLADAVAGGIRNHVVNGRLGNVPISVTHCDRSQCTQVYRPKDSERLQLRVGGWQDGKMLLRHADWLFPQGTDSAPAQLLAVPHQITTWGEWKKSHPESTVYTGDAAPTA